jgi:hypothetical protein
MARETVEFAQQNPTTGNRVKLDRLVIVSDRLFDRA